MERFCQATGSAGNAVAAWMKHTTHTHTGGLRCWHLPAGLKARLAKDPQGYGRPPSFCSTQAYSRAMLFTMSPGFTSGGSTLNV